MVFDLDGCLIRSNVFKRNAYFEIFANLAAGGRDELVRQALANVPHGNRFEVIGRVLQLAGGGQAADLSVVNEYAKRYNDLCEAFAIRCDEVPGAAAALVRLASRFPLYTNSATPQEPLERVIAGRGWAPLFREVLGGPRSKAANLRRVATREEVSPDRIVFVGDEERDYAAARDVGCRFIGLRNPQSDFSRPPAAAFDDMHAVGRFLMGPPAERV